MAVSELMTPGGDILRDFPAHTVYIRNTHAAAWEEVEYLYALGMTWAVSPQTSSAVLEWRYGIGRQAGVAEEATEIMQDYLDCQVRIKITDGDEDRYWHGVILEARDAADGALLDGEDRILTGRQLFVAYGLEVLFDRTYMLSSWYKLGIDTYELQRGLEFNADNAFADTGNRSASPGPDGAYVFTDDLSASASAYWSTANIVKYLLQYHGPLDAEGNTQIPFTLSEDSTALLPDWDRPKLPTDARSIRQVLNQLLDRRRGFAWTVYLNYDQSPPEDVILQVYVFNAEPIVLPGGGTQNGSPFPTTLDFDRALDVRATLTDSALHKVEQVVVLGGRKRTCCSFSYQDGTLQADWTAAAETAYEAGPAGIGALDTHEQERRVDIFRQSDAYERVFSWFRVPDTFNGTVGNGVGGGSVAWFPDDPYYGAEKFYLPDLRFERTLPRGLTTAPSGSPDDQAPPVALIRTEQNASSAWPYEYLEKLGACGGVEGLDDADGQGEGRTWSASLRMQEDTLGVIVKVKGKNGKPHSIAVNQFAQAFAWDKPATLDWQYMVVTAMVTLDTRVEKRYPENVYGDRLGSDVARRAFINLGNKARLDYVTASTVLGAVNGVLMYPAAAYYSRDDRDEMEDLARFAYEWYGVERHAYSFQIKQLTGILEVGMLLTEIGGDGTEQTVNALVTSVSFDLVSGRTSVQTSFAELDFASYYRG